MNFIHLIKPYSIKDISEGFNLFGHDSSYVLLNSSQKNIFAISTERINRVKHSTANPLDFFSISGNACNNSFLDFGTKFGFFGLGFFYVFNSEKIRKIIYGDISVPVRGYSRYKKLFLFFFRSPFLFLQTLFHCFSKSFFKKYQEQVTPNKHHLCHAIPSYCFSPFYGHKALAFVLDGKGDNEYSSLWLCNNSDSKFSLISESKIQIFSKNTILNSYNYASIGYLYSCFTVALGFIGNSDEGKTEALAAYGKVDIKLYDKCLSGYSVNPNDLIWEHNIDIIKELHNIEYLKQQIAEIGRENFAATIQKFLEDTVVEYLNAVYKKYPLEYLCLSGGTMANVILNLNIYERTPFKNIYIFPAMGDEGTAVGASIIESMHKGDDLSWLPSMIMPYWGPSFTLEEIKTVLRKCSDRINWTDVDDTWPERAANLINNGKIIAVFQGRMEFGPRALGNRSILADPRDSTIREKMNLSIKRRPYFQPFCPSILEEDRERLFTSSYPNKHMSIAFRLRDEFREKLPSACHIDGTARPQFVEKTDNPQYFRILSELKRLTGYGVVVNTSFNLHGRAMVMSPEQAIRDFLDCNLDALFIEGCYVTRK